MVFVKTLKGVIIVIQIHQVVLFNLVHSWLTRPLYFDKL